MSKLKTPIAIFIGISIIAASFMYASPEKPKTITKPTPVPLPKTNPKLSVDAYNATRNDNINWYKATLLLVKKWEGYSSKYYNCSANVKTIGWGLTKPELDFLNKQFGTNHRLKDLLDKNPLALPQELLKASIEYRFSMYRKLFPILEANEMGAIISLSFNVGDDALLKSTLKKKLRIVNKEARLKACEKVILSFSKCKGKVLSGLLNRRKDEVKLLKGDISPFTLQCWESEVSKLNSNK